MKINNANLKFKNSLTRRSKTTAIVLHHAAASKCSVHDVHSWHLANGWAGIGYHFFVRKDGSVWQGRPIDKVGSHAKGANSYSIGICFEGDFTRETMPSAQITAGKEVVSYVRGKYPTITIIKKHKEVNSTTCPGEKFPFAQIAAGVSVSAGSEAKSGTVKASFLPATVYAHPTKSAARVATMQTDINYTYTSVYVGGDKVKWYLVKVGNAKGWVSEKALSGCPYAEPKITTYAGCPRGDAVRWAQWHLISAGYSVGAKGIDGSFGPATDAAVERFQKAKKLLIDGRVGPATREALKRAVK